MDQRVVEFRVGVLVLASLVIGAILVMLFQDRPSLFRGTRVIYIDLPSARGVTSGTPIRKRGILIGRVTDIQPDEENDQVRLKAEIYRDVQLYKDEICQLRVSLLGDAELEMVSPEREQRREASSVRSGRGSFQT